jgi:hypothetical protein
MFEDLVRPNKRWRKSRAFLYGSRTAIGRLMTVCGGVSLDRRSGRRRRARRSSGAERAARAGSQRHGVLDQADRATGRHLHGDQHAERLQQDLPARDVEIRGTDTPPALWERSRGEAAAQFGRANAVPFSPRGRGAVFASNSLGNHTNNITAPAHW